MPEDLKEVEVKDIFVGWSKSDRRIFPLFAADNKITAARLAKGKNWNGDDAIITPEVAYKIPGAGGKWYIPGIIEQPSPQDLEERALISKMKDFLSVMQAANINLEDVKSLISRCENVSINKFTDNDLR